MLTQEQLKKRRDKYHERKTDPIYHNQRLQHNLKYYGKFIKKRTELAKLYNSKCFICNKKFGKFFVFHHKQYNNLKYTSKGYWRKVLDEIEQSPEIFMLVCKPCHGYLEHIIHTNGGLDRFIEAVKSTKTI